MLKKVLKKIFSNRGIISKKYIAKFLPSNPVILEAGADCGSDTLEMLKIWPGATIYAFEPVQESFKKLKQNTAKHPSIHSYNLALSNNNGTSKMYVSNTLSSSSLLLPKEHLRQHPEISFNNTIIVETITISEWAKKENVGSIDFLWLDLQGNELSVLMKSKNILNGVKVIYTEVSLIENYEGVPLYSDLKKYLLSQGFIVKKEELPWKDMGNVLFVKK